MIVDIALQTGWSPADVRAMSLAELGVVQKRLADRARQARMRAAAARVRGRGR